MGEHLVTRDMAMDAGDPSLEGRHHSFEYAPCEACDGTGAVGRDEEVGPQDDGGYVCPKCNHTSVYPAHCEFPGCGWKGAPPDLVPATEPSAGPWRVIPNGQTGDNAGWLVDNAVDETIFMRDEQHAYTVRDALNRVSRSTAPTKTEP
jgi:hypothetical protein